jgi:hypothetical protein
MTGMHTAPVEPPVRERRATRWVRRIPSWVLFVIGCATVALLIPLSIWLTNSTADTQASADASAAKVTAVQSQAAPLAGQVQSVCDQGGAAATELNNAGACTQASKVQSVIAGPPGPTGPPGSPGANGRGIASTHLANGDLIVVYTDGTAADVGTVTGPQGETGTNGRGISGSAIVGTDLVITYSDGTSNDLGNVVGPQGGAGETGATGPAGSNGTNGSNGVGVSSVVVNSSGHMIVTYSDGSTSDAGPVPQAQPCPDGSAPSTTDITEPSGLSTSTVNGVLVCGS